MKSVMLSIKPKYCELIASGKKTIEVRKTRPRIKTPFKCYIYCTKEFYRKGDGYFQGKYCGKVIGEFVCDEIYQYTTCDAKDGVDISDGEMTRMSCLTKDEITNYELSPGYFGVFGWHISDLVIYDKPKELSGFYKHDNTYDNAFGWVFKDRPKKVPIKKPPQSWYYVEV